MLRFMIAALIAAFATVPAAQARRHHRSYHPKATQIVIGCLYDNSGHQTCLEGQKLTVARPYGSGRVSGGGEVVGGRRPGFPWAFCGAEASYYVFGVAKRELWLAANWIRKFPRTSPAPGMAAARNHHVMILISHIGGSDWRVHDGNSGGHLTRDHVRSINGYIIVDPHGGRYASR